MIPIFTIGYGNRSIEVFLSILKEHCIGVLIDVRSKPYSRYNLAYSSAELKKHLAVSNITYLYMGDGLGGRPQDETLLVNGRVSHELVRKSSAYPDAIKQVMAKAKEGTRVCVMCSELDPDHCHRKKLLTPDLVAAGAIVFHIDARGKVVEHVPLPVQEKLF